VVFAGGRGRAGTSDPCFFVVDGREGPAYDLIHPFVFNGNHTIRATALRVNPETFEDEIVRLELHIAEDSKGLGVTREP
jgi:hypothetical protein